jgi:23S rRNA (cytidine1920-2'-O)/16S rRNA (cytidine1409-2'-O)-methyltransferase
VRLSAVPDIVVADVSFISLREILPHVAAELSGPATRIVAMVKPQFEAGQGVSSAPRGDAGQSGHDAVGQSTCGAARQPAGHTSSRLKHKGVIKNDSMRRNILKDFESWARQRFVIIDKADSAVSGAKGNQERFYLLRKL